MRKILTYCTFVIASLIVAAAFVTSKSYTQLAIATLFYPPLVYFAFRLFPRRTRKAYSIKPIVHQPAIATQPVNKSESGTVDLVDIDKRAFLKLIGAAGLSYFIFSIFTKRAEALFFGKATELGMTALKDRDGNQINPAEREATDGYQVSDIDQSDPIFCGFINKNGGWFIVRESEEEGSFRYTKGETNYNDNWTNREHLKYDYFHNVFAK